MSYRERFFIAYVKSLSCVNIFKIQNAIACHLMSFVHVYLIQCRAEFILLFTILIFNEIIVSISSSTLEGSVALDCLPCAVLLSNA